MGSLNQRNIVVLFGSQTGTAQEVAERIGREGERLHFNMEVTCMDSFDIRQLPTTPLVVYVASTTGMYNTQASHVCLIDSYCDSNCE